MDRGIWTGRPTDNTRPAVAVTGPQVFLRSNRRTVSKPEQQYVPPIRSDNTYVWYPTYYYSPSWVATPSWTTTVTPTMVTTPSWATTVTPSVLYTPLPPPMTPLPLYW
ncbi:hypothetical protein D9757_004273 [Collybiopsis confluens]|uniref:Uncharacterized protein n=1 Tax=Collybiopsis confluens TaxID=2823264 RepID=A0A8H5MCZ8_9AGAR|nr:hypothetical protein D9757_004273 [Collybiopsis confluens]